MDLKSRYENLIEQSRGCKNIFFIVLILASIFFIGLGIGLLIKPNKSAPIIIDKNAKINLPEQSRPSSWKNLSQSTQNFDSANSGNFVASINGKNYYPQNCPSAKRIKEENKIWFNNSEEAEMQGYKPAQNCP